MNHFDQNSRQDAKLFYEENGYVLFSELVAKQDVEVLSEGVQRLVEKSRCLNQSDGVFDLEIGHSQNNPRLRRIAYLDDLDPVFWDFASNSVVTDAAEILFGPDVTFRECIINFKWSGGGQEVKWHQDIPFYPHTNLSTAQFLVFLDDVTSEQGPLQVVPKSHTGPVFDHFDSDNNWLGYIGEELLHEIPLDSAVEITGKAGSVSVHHCGTVHGSAPNLSSRSRPTLILGYNASDARPYTAAAYPSSHYGEIVRGSPAKYARHDPVSLRLPPDWSGGYTSIFAHQGHEPNAV